MKVAYIFRSPNASYLLGKMIIPQLEEKRHGAEVAGMFFFEDNAYLLRKGDVFGEKLNKFAEGGKMLLMGCDQCCFQRELADKLVSNAKIGCFPDLYGALAEAGIDQVITL
ncbi:sulfur reduction protein DsrE [Candidatus Micrarchaeota archaeon]|nr:sulfur reduction protein DsrE [Candidatus Micrarchaeota archaeon]MBU1939571.1 sulfur reduction protein DsrE [Candidatus Micrarchaeota archaeon]